ncbi:calphotin [Galendromus occidentalis]|uniref:Calphotin n=1 Tax=Galendromus occidentalis TaxID=34638 RepID=A0AAJ6QNN1_9ACAR|nr:calphotin [Galendromus occidentalis]
MTTFWAIAGALCLAVGLAQAAPTAEVARDVADGVNHISEKSDHPALVVSTEVDAEVAIPALVARISTILTAATPAVYQDASKNSNELSENVVKPVTLLLNSVGGGVTTLAKDNARRFFVPSFVRFNFRQDALQELDRIRRTERFWNETEEYVNNVCSRLKKFIDIQRRRRPHGVSAQTASTTAAPSPASTVTTTAAPVEASPASTSSVVKSQGPAAIERSDPKLSIHENVEPIKIPLDHLPDKSKTVKPLHHPQQSVPALKPQPIVQAAPEPVGAASESVDVIVSVNGSSPTTPTGVSVETSSIPSKIEPTPTEKPQSTTVGSESDLTTESVVGTVRPAALPAKIPSPEITELPKDLTASLDVAESSPVQQIAQVPFVTAEPQPSHAAPELQPKSAVTSETEPTAAVAAVAEKKDLPLTAPVVAAAPALAVTPVAQEKSLAVSKVKEESPSTLPPPTETKVSIVPADDVKTPVAVQTKSTAPVVAPVDTVEPKAVPVDIVVAKAAPVDITAAKAVPADSVVAKAAPVDEAPVDVKPAVVAPATSAPVTVPEVLVPETVTIGGVSPSAVVTTIPFVSSPEPVSTPALLPIPTTTSIPLVKAPSPVVTPKVPEAGVAPTLEAEVPVVPKIESPTEIVKPIPEATIEPVVKNSVIVTSPAVLPPVTTPVPQEAPSHAQADHSPAESSIAAVTVQTPVPKVTTTTETVPETTSVASPSTEKPVVKSPVVEPAKPIEQLQSAASQDAKPPSGGIHRVHPIKPTIIFPSKASPAFSQSMKVIQSTVAHSDTPESSFSSVTSTTVATSSASFTKSSKSETFRSEQIAITSPVVIRPVKSILPVTIPQRAPTHNVDMVSVVRTHV